MSDDTLTAWAERLTHQECQARKHGEWWADTEYHLTCGWCERDEAQAQAARVRDIPERKTPMLYESDQAFQRGWAACRAEVLRRLDGPEGDR